MTLEWMVINMMLYLLLIGSLEVYCKKIHIDSIVPTAGPLSGNTRVLVRGSNLEEVEGLPPPVCRFGGNSKVVNATFVKCSPHPQHPDEPDPLTEEKTEHCIECGDSPPSDEEDMVPFSVSLTGDFSDVENSVDFQYYKNPSVHYIVPPYGPKNGGTIVTVYGENFIDFDQYLRCSFGVKDVAAKFISDTVLQCASPFSDVVVAAQPFRVTMNDQQSTRDDITYWYYLDVSISKLTPNRGPMSGGNEVMIDGKNLDPFNDVLEKVNNHNDTFCMFGEFYTPATVYSDLLISCVAPPSPVIRTVIVDVTLNNADRVLNPGSWTDDHLEYTYYAPPFVFDVEPKVGPTVGDTVVHIAGSNFNDTDQIQCKFGNKVVKGEFVSVNEITCTSPEVENPGYVDLSISLSDENFGTPLQYLYYAAPEITSFDPMCGPTTGYTQISIYGKNFVFTGEDLVFCIFDEQIVPAAVASSEEIICDSPDITLIPKMLEKMSAKVGVTLNKKDYIYGGQEFMYYKFHKLTAIHPNKGPLYGASEVTLEGEHFAQTGVCNVTVRFGTTEALTYSHNDTFIHAYSPSVEVPGDAIVQVALNGQQFTDMRSHANLGGSKSDEGVLYYHYYGPALVTNFAPKQGPDTGNSTITLDGTGFMVDNSSDVFLQFRDSKGKVIENGDCYYISENSLKCLTPATPPKTTTKLFLSQNGIDYTEIKDIVSGDEYYFYSAPVIDSISPEFGPVKEDVGNITLTGKGFECMDGDCSELKCRFGTKPYPIYEPATRLSSSELTCVIPQLSRPEVVTVEASLNGFDFTHNLKNYTYYDAYVLDIFPKSGKVQGGTMISVMGFGFANTGEDLICRFGSDEEPLLCGGSECEVQAVYVSDTEILCETFPQSEVTYSSTGENIEFDEFDVEISVRNRKFTHSHVKYNYIQEPDYLLIDPIEGTANGGTYIVVSTDFHWSENTTSDEVHDLKLEAAPKCKFIGKDRTEIVDANIITYPFSDDKYPNSIACTSPSWASSEEVKVQMTINGVDYGESFTYKYIEKISGLTLSPSCGPNKGGTPISIEGSGFGDSDLHIKWGTQSTVAQQTTATRIESHSVATITNNTHGGFLFLQLGENRELKETENDTYTVYEEYTEDKLLYFYYMEPTLFYIFPRGGPNTGKTTVTLGGSWFLNYPSISCTPWCKFGDTVVPGEFLSTVRVVCESPPYSDSTGSVPVELSFNGVDWTNSSLHYVYYSKAAITSISPTIGPSTGGTIVTIHGSNFTGEAKPEDFLCKFHSKSLAVPDKIIKATFQDSETIWCVSPGGWGSGTEASIDITFNQVDFSVSNTSFFFFQIDGSRPMSGPLEGSPLGISVFGSGFAPNNKSLCIFNNEEYPPINTEPDHILCPMPAKSDNMKGQIPFEVTANGVDFQKFLQGFVYFEQPSVTLVEPLSGPINGGSLLTVFGEGFRNDFQQANVTCRIGDFYAPANVIDSTTIQCTTPSMSRPSNSTRLPVQIALNGQDYSNNTDVYAVYGLTDVSPKSGPISGGTEVFVKGFGFTEGNAKCRFGIDSNYLIVDGTVLDSKRMMCISPAGFKVPSFAGLPLDVPFEIAFSDNKFHPWTRTANKFRLYENPKILSIDPNTGWVDEQETVVITSDKAKGFFPAITGWKASGELDLLHAIVCKFGDYGTVPAQYVNHTAIRCVTPDSQKKRKDLHSDAVTLQVALNGQDFFDAGTYVFKGTASGLWVVLMWLVIILLTVAIALLLVTCCYYMWHNKSLTVPNVSELSDFAKNQMLQQRIGG